MIGRVAFAILLPFVLLVIGAPFAGAQEWHEAYRDGLKALAQNQPARAVGLLEYAVSQRPQPGRDVVTYGTNVERQYYPYVKLAEAYLRLHDLAGVRSALKRSETWAREPAEERRRLAAQLDALDAAAARLDTGTYGVCEHCGAEIEVERLDALPGTRHCVDCARVGVR